MSFLRSVVADLLEKRLWPVALVLIVGVVGVPVALSRSSEEPSSTTPVAAEQSAHATRPAVAIAPADASTRNRRGTTRDPFKQRRVKLAASTATADGATPTAASNGQATGSEGSSSPSGSDGSSAPSETSPSSGSTAPDTTTVKLRFGTTEGTLALLSDVPRLKPLPSVEDPFFVFLGVLEDGKTAVFLISSDATAVGDGTCRPSKDDCQTVELEEDETEFFDLVVEGQPVQYQLDVVDIDVVKSEASASAARAAISRHSEAGAEILRDAHLSADDDFAGTDGYRWRPESGLLVRVPAKARARSSADEVHTSSADASAADGEHVWHYEPAR